MGWTGRRRERVISLLPERIESKNILILNLKAKSWKSIKLLVKICYNWYIIIGFCLQEYQAYPLLGRMVGKSTSLKNLDLPY